MAGKGSRRDDKSASPKRLRRRLQKAEARLAVARDKRDRAQARVEALGMIADEVRATLSEVEKAATQERAAAQEKAAAPEKAAPHKQPGARSRPSASRPTKGRPASPPG